MRPAPRIRNAYSASRAGELPAPGLLGSAGCSDWATGAEDPEGPAAHPGGASCLLLSFGDLPRRSDRAAGTEDPEGCNASKLKGACAFQ